MHSTKFDVREKETRPDPWAIGSDEILVPLYSHVSLVSGVFKVHSSLLIVQLHQTGESDLRRNGIHKSNASNKS